MVINKKDPPRIKELKHKSRRLSIKEGILASSKMSFGDKFVQPFAIAINTSNPLVALLTSISGFLGPLSQVLTAQKYRNYSRKKVVLVSVFLETLMWLPFIAIAFLFSKGILTNILPVFLLSFFSIYVIVSNASYPYWFSWVGDIVDEKFRGRWFSKRNLFIGIVSVVLSIFASLFLDYFKKLDLAMTGFAILFALAFISRFGSLTILKKQYEPEFKFKKKDYFSFWQFLKQSQKNNFGKFATFRALFAFAGAISGAVWSIYFLRYLNFSYFNYMVILVSGTLFSLLFIEFWGKIIDKYGNYKVLILTTIFLPLTPLLWILSPSLIYLIFVPSLIEGIAWGGFILAVKNYIYDNVRKEKRSLAISYYTMLWGIGVSAGAGIAALLIKYLTIKFIEPIKLIFLISAIIEMIVVFWWIPKLKEVRKNNKIFKPKNFRKLIINQAKSSIIEEAHELLYMRKYLLTK